MEKRVGTKRGEAKPRRSSTGFLGKVLIEKLLRSCPDIFKIYVLIRPKKDKCPASRMDEMCEKPLYDRVRREVPNFRKRIVPIIGDINIEGFGLSENDQNLVINEVSIIFHLAANVRFKANIKTSTVVNVNAVGTILKLAKRMPNLKSLVHVSTIYANCHVEHIEERCYSYPINYQDLIMFTRNLPEIEVQKKISRIISRWPNVYTFTKAMAEGLVRDKSGDLPVGIFRPAIVLATANEPLVGWIDNIYGPLGIMVNMLLGHTRFHHCNSDLKADLVPVDFTINALIASAWDISNQCRKGKDMIIYNFVSPVDRPTWNEYSNTLLDTNKIYPLHSAIYYPCMTYLKRNIPYRICVWLYHFLPALLVDAANICMNRRPRMLKLCLMIDKYCNAAAPFCNNEWSYSTDNVQVMWDRLGEEDQKLFKFNMFGFDWTKYIVDHYKGIRLFLLKDDDSTLEISRIKHKRLYWIHQTLRIVFVFIGLWIIWLMFTIIYV
ncbi:PREDICTED: putative fatty acyl-CoA reductase CG5065 isoform X2 [Vollenhovia emeryi]|uniref:putative fatty acyl-CoA reductase CG5065 isoform X2 n=1 Tax=Vollenhovia emeryi TaxID=411798 RepID=UPI0005F3B0C6|nr:PREDICTED: putative fatty acyl-CoA reductase CG5065 isoform X2 [Vollenhovia emeryi]